MEQPVMATQQQIDSPPYQGGVRGGSDGRQTSPYPIHIKEGVQEKNRRLGLLLIGFFAAFHILSLAFIILQR